MLEAITVLYEDEHVIAVDKPAGRLVVPGRGAPAGPTVQQEIAGRLGARIWTVHRLDRETSGVLLFAKDAEAHKFLSRQFEERRMRKAYAAAVLGRVEAEEGVIDRPLREFGSGRTAVDARGKPSRTRYRVLERGAGATLLEVEPMTGRRHQIRVHLYSIGHPVLGDTVYGKERPVGGAKRLLLHAQRLAFEGPDGRAVEVVSELPGDFETALER